MRQAQAPAYDRSALRERTYVQEPLHATLRAANSRSRHRRLIRIRIRPPLCSARRTHRCAMTIRVQIASSGSHRILHRTAPPISPLRLPRPAQTPYTNVRRSHPACLPADALDALPRILSHQPAASPVLLSPSSPSPDFSRASLHLPCASLAPYGPAPIYGTTSQRAPHPSGDRALGHHWEIGITSSPGTECPIPSRHTTRRPGLRSRDCSVCRRRCVLGRLAGT